AALDGRARRDWHSRLGVLRALQTPGGLVGESAHPARPAARASRHRSAALAHQPLGACSPKSGHRDAGRGAVAFGLEPTGRAFGPFAGYLLAQRGDWAVRRDRLSRAAGAPGAARVARCAARRAEGRAAAARRRLVPGADGQRAAAQRAGRERAAAIQPEPALQPAALELRTRLA